MQTLVFFLTALHPAAPPDGAREPWASMSHPRDVAKEHVEDVTAARHQYGVTQGGTMDGTNCRSPVGGGFAIWEQSWESNRAIRLENVGTTDVINPWLSNGRNDFRSVSEIVARVVRPGMTDREKAIALWRLQTTHRFHASTGDNEVNDPVKVFNVYGYTTCGNDSICLAGMWRAAGLTVRPARCPGHCISQVQFDGRWNLLDGDLGPFYLLRDNATIAGENDLVRDHDLLKRSHTRGILDPDSRAEDEFTAALFLSETDWPGTRDSVRTTTMNMTLRPGEAIVWRWGHLAPVKYHGPTDIKVFGPRSNGGKVWGGHAADRVCNGNWEYRPDFTRDLWRKGAEKVENVAADRGELVPEAGMTGAIVWKMRSPYPFVGGKLDADGTGVKFSLSWDGVKWHDLADGLEAMFHFPHKGDARYEYRLRCELPTGSRLRRLAILNDLQMAPLALPGMAVGENRFTYTDETPGPRQVRLTHEWVERSLSRPPRPASAPVFPADGGRTDRTDITFEWQPAEDPDGDAIADYHFQLADRPDMAWPLSSNFEKLVSNTADRGRPRYRLPSPGLLTPGQKYYWRVRAKDAHGGWGPWGATWSFTASGPAPPVDVRLEPLPSDNTRLTLHWKPGPGGEKPVKYRVYGSDEKGFSVSDEAYAVNVGASDLPRKFAANFAAETAGTESIVLGPGLDVPNANKAFYRVVAVDAAEKRSGPSDYAVAPRPFVTTRPPDRATVGAKYSGSVVTIRSLGDLRSYQSGQKTESTAACTCSFLPAGTSSVPTVLRKRFAGRNSRFSSTRITPWLSSSPVINALPVPALRMTPEGALTRAPLVTVRAAAKPPSKNSMRPLFVKSLSANTAEPFRSKAPLEAMVVGPLTVSTRPAVSNVWTPVPPPRVRPAIVTLEDSVTAKVPSEAIRAVSLAVGSASVSQLSGLFQSKFPPPPSQLTASKRTRPSSGSQRRRARLNVSRFLFVYTFRSAGRLNKRPN